MPKLSIITVNLNNLPGLKRTMESVFDQIFTDYEYIIIDGASSEGSKEYIEQQAGKLSYWVSEKDKGIYNAMNKGIKKANGEYLIFLNSGDYFFRADSLKLIALPDIKEDLVYGNMMLNHEDSIDRQTYPSFIDFEYFFEGNTLPHHSTLIKRDLFKTVGLYNEELKMLSDREFFMNAVCLYKASYRYIPVDVAVFCYDGFCSQPENNFLYEEEFKKIYNKNYSAFEGILRKKSDYKSKLTLIENSRVHKVAKSIIDNQLYKYLKKKLRF